MSQLQKQVKATVHSDGGSRGNPGPAGIGCVLRINREKTFEISEHIGKKTNNQAEYGALIAGMKLAKKKKVNDLICFLDSELVVKQMLGQYRVKDTGLKVLYKEAKKITVYFDKITFKHVMREKNKEADRLVNIALDNKTP